MEVRFETIPAKKLVGKHLTMSFANNRTFELWKSFMPHRSQISNNLNSELISLQLFGQDFSFQNFNPNLAFPKWLPRTWIMAVRRLKADCNSSTESTSMIFTPRVRVA